MMNSMASNVRSTSVTLFHDTDPSQDSDLCAFAAYSSNVTAGNNVASNWGGNIDLAGLPDWAHSLAATNITYAALYCYLSIADAC